MSRGLAALAAALGVLAMAPVGARAACEFGQLAELPVTASNLSPLVSVKIDGNHEDTKS